MQFLRVSMDLSRGMSDAVAPNPPNLEQASAIEFASGSLRIMAGAGAGKTFTLTESIVSLITRGLATPSQILALTFTTKAAEELRSRIDAAVHTLPGASESVDIDTYHAFGGRVVAEHGYRIGLPPDPLILTQAESWITLWRSLDRIPFASVELANLRDTQNSPLSKIVSLGSRLRDELRELDDLRELVSAGDGAVDADFSDYLAALRVYEEAKRTRGAIDYGDQIALACELLNNDEVLAVYRNRYRYLLVDEFQDTNYAQSVMVHALGAALDGNVRVVGDPNQAIYRFRGASPDNLERFARDDFPAAHTVELRQNYRSTGAILAAANAVWEGDPGPYRGNLKAASGQFGERPQLVQCEWFADEIAYIAAEIMRLVGNGRDYRDIAVIVRKNSLKRSIARGLTEWGIPAEAVGGSSLYESPVVRLLISALRVIGDPLDDAALAHLLTADRWGIDERALYLLARTRSRRAPLLAEARRIVATDAGLEMLDLADCLQEIERLNTRSYRISLPKLVDDIIASIGGAFDEVEEANARRFRTVVQQFAESRVEQPRLTDLLAYITLLIDAGAEDEAISETELGKANTVKVLTAHAAKGLEWPVVFVAGVNKNDFVTPNSTDVLLPELIRPVAGMPVREHFDDGAAGGEAFGTAVKAWQKEQNLLEERRVLYVAMTRARELLYLTWSVNTPTRKRATSLYGPLAPVVDHCIAVTAPESGPKPGNRSLEEFARASIPPLTPLLATIAPGQDREAELLQTFGHDWLGWGGSADDLNPILSSFAERRGSLRNLTASLQALERTQERYDTELRPNGAISYSQLDVYKACPHRYYLRHVIGLPGLPQTFAARFGTAFHEAIALEAKARMRGTTLSDESLQSVVAAGAATGTGHVANIGPPLSAHDPVREYLKSVDRLAEPLLIEEAFTLRLGEAVLHGVIDRVHRLPDGEVEIVDYKTDAQVRTEAQIRDGLQLQIYLLACREAFPEIQPSPRRAAMFFVRHGARVEIEFTDAELAAARGEIIARAALLRSVRPDQHSATAETCRHCEFRMTCRFSLA